MSRGLKSSLLVVAGVLGLGLISCGSPGAPCEATASCDGGAGGGPGDAGFQDAGFQDAELTDAGAEDAGVADAGIADAGVEDAGTADAGVEDAGIEDAGVDAGSDDAGVDAGCSPSAELCDGLDNDCNGTIDDGLGQTICGVGACERSVLNCMNGTPQTCVAGTPVADICDGRDNNCNGTTDEGNPNGGATCNTGEPGLCSVGTLRCSNGSLGCVHNVPPATEVCDGRDNNCNGTTDEGTPGSGTPCATGLVGVCGGGTLTCSGGSLGCVQSVQPSPERCDGLDNNCNGGVDEGSPDAGVSCMTGLSGVCSTGISACTGGSLSCNQTTQPAAERCDGLDNNCNGAADDGDPDGGAGCVTGLLGVGTDGGNCGNGVRHCVSAQIRCVAPDGC